MRVVVLVGSLAACSFAPRGAPSTDPDIDAPELDAPTIDAAFACPAGYAPLAGGAAASRYKINGASGPPAGGPGPGRGTWLEAEADCRDDGPGTHLAIPETEAEHQAFVDVVSGASRWLGATDRITEGSWLPIIGGTAGFVQTHWIAGVPGINAISNCLLLTRVQDLDEATPCNGEGQLPSEQWDKGYICECDREPVDQTTF